MLYYKRLSFGYSNILIVHLLIACVDVYYLFEDNMVSWKLGSCTNDKGYWLSSKDNAIINIVRCCLQPGEYILTCQAANAKTWLTGYVLINGRKYCHDFIGLKGFRRLEINRKSELEMFFSYLPTILTCSAWYVGPF